MNKEVFPALCVFNNIERGIQAGIYDGELSETWKRRMEMKRTVEDSLAKAAKGNIKAMRNLEGWYKEGMNELPKDEAKAEEWRKKAIVKGWQDMAETGDGEAMYKLGIACRTGTFGLAEDDVEAFSWYRKASDAGNTKALAFAGNLQIKGCGTKKNAVSGFIRLVSAAKDGSDCACYRLGLYHYKGLHGVEKDAKQALYWLKMAVGGKLKYQHTTEDGLERARQWISEMEKEGGEK